MSGGRLPVTIVRACLRDGAGGSPTAVLDEAPLSDEERRRVAAATGTSHAVFVSVPPDRGARAAPGGPEVGLRFFTAEGELPACGHGTVAALAYLAARDGTAETSGHRARLRTAGRVFDGRCVRRGGRLMADFDPGPVNLREPAAAESGLVLSALGIGADELASAPRAASVGRWRLLVPVRSRGALAALAPDPGQLREACDRLGLLGCYAYSPPSPSGRLAARMFAPSIGVPEDIANANSTACLAAHLAGRGAADLTVDMGDRLGAPATITATAHPAPAGSTGPVGPVVRVGGFAEVPGSVHLFEVPGGSDAPDR
ncbi:PhzF family phenazine biosynthesis protein [Streptomyces sp. HPF1205]|uniref:PhzF family phenazine biosynthesis protein n=1 Tax=Streptomyces sp. HPF1205 TaxID=2873262 RepID=UPI001CEDF2AB|nr:PhzF family phenazine biosynthesis isomerase [Streptomyces sp. HPF1205]